MVESRNIIKIHDNQFGSSTIICVGSIHALKTTSQAGKKIKTKYVWGHRTAKTYCIIIPRE